MSQASISLIQELYGAFGRGDIPALLAKLTGDAIWRVNGATKEYPVIGTWKGTPGAGEFFKQVAAHEDFSAFTPLHFYADTDKVFVLGHYVLTIKKTGKQVDTDWVHVFTVRDGKVAGFTEFTDTAQFVDGYRG